MAKKSVIESTCDSCGKIVHTDLHPTPKRAEFDLPDGWLHIQADDKHKQIFAMDLCDECSREVRKFAGVSANSKGKKNV